MTIMKQSYSSTATKILTACVGLVAMCGLASVELNEPSSASASAVGPGSLFVHSENPRYFTDGKGKVIYLTGSHDGRDWVYVDAKTFGAYLDFLKKNNHNFIRLWTWEAASTNDGQNWALRTGPGTAFDGKLKFDLTEYHPTKFSNLRQRVLEACDYGIYVSIMLFEGCGLASCIKMPWITSGYSAGLSTSKPWSSMSPFNAANNVNGIDGDPNRDDYPIEIHSLAIPAVTNIQKAYIRKVIDTVNDLDNVLYEITNESGAFSKDWQYAMIDYIHDYESGRIDGVAKKKHPVGMTALYSSTFPSGPNSDLFASRADWISPFDYNDTNIPVATGAKVIILDTDHILMPDDRKADWVWKSFTRGHNPILLDPNVPGGAQPNPTNEPLFAAARAAMGHAQALAQRVNLQSMTPRGDLASTGFALAEPGVEYVVYAPAGGNVSVNLSGTVGTFGAEWIRPVQGVVTAAGDVTGGATVSITAPFTGAAVLHLFMDPSGPAAPAGLRLIQ